MKNSIFARFARAFFIFWHFGDVLVLSTTWNDLFCSCLDDVSIWFLCPKGWFQLNSRIVRTHFSSIMSLSNWKRFAETRSHIFRWRSRFQRRRVCLSSLITHMITDRIGLHSHPLTITNCGAMSVGKWTTKIWYETNWYGLYCHRKEITKLTFRASALHKSEWRRANARNAWFGMSSRWIFDPYQLVWYVEDSIMQL